MPINQLSLIYLVKEHWLAKNQKTIPFQALPSNFSITATTSRIPSIPNLSIQSRSTQKKVVELCGIEPQTSCVQGRRSPS